MQSCIVAVINYVKEKCVLSDISKQLEEFRFDLYL